MTREEKTLELSRDMEEIEEIINCDADAKIKLKMISNIVYSKPHYFKTLEQEPCENAISRQAVLDLIVANHTELNGLNVVMYSPLYKDIIQLPSVKPQEPKTGHWIEDEYEMEVRCSACGEENDECSKYCPNCGAKMVEQQEISDHNLKMWHDIYEEEKRREGSE